MTMEDVVVIGRHLGAFYWAVLRHVELVEIKAHPVFIERVSAGRALAPGKDPNSNGP